MDDQPAIKTNDLAEKVRLCVPTSLAAGQIPQSAVMAFLAPLIDECNALRARIAELEKQAA